MRKLTDWEIEFIQERLLHGDKEKGDILKFFSDNGAIGLNDNIDFKFNLEN